MTSDKPTVHVITRRTQSPRLRYVLDFIFGEILSADYRLASPDFEPEESILRIDYCSEMQNSDAVTVWDCGQLDEWMDPEVWVGPQKRGAFTLSTDIFAEIFFHLSRMEEYGVLPRDEYGRHRASDSYLGKKDALATPRVDQLIAALRQHLKRRGWNLSYRSNFLFTATYDVDYPWLFMYRGWKQDLRGLAGDFFKGRWLILSDRLRVWSGSKKDPYDVWDRIVLMHQSTKVQANFFLLLTDRRGVDPPVPHRSKYYKHLVERLRETGKIGWHPGYYSLENELRWNREKKTFQELLGASPQFSRQHYLRLEWPKTYRKLLSAGIEADYSLGYADQPGFRAGTSHPFYWYDLENESVTPLKLYPLAFMEVTFKRYLGLSPRESFEKMINIERQVRKYKGHLIGLWHNNSFYPREGWSCDWLEIYIKFIKRFKA